MLFAELVAIPTQQRTRATEPEETFGILRHAVGDQRIGQVDAVGNRPEHLVGQALPGRGARRMCGGHGTDAEGQKNQDGKR